MKVRCSHLPQAIGFVATLLLLSVINSPLFFRPLVTSYPDRETENQTTESRADNLPSFYQLRVRVPVKLKILEILKFRSQAEQQRNSNGNFKQNFQTNMSLYRSFTRSSDSTGSVGGKMNELDTSQSHIEGFKKTIQTVHKKNISRKDPCLLDLEVTSECYSLINSSNLEGSTSNSRSNTSSCSLEKLLENCTRFRIAHAYYSKLVSKEEESYPLAFAIKMHTSASQAEQLLRTIYRPHNVYCIHVDLKAPKGIYETMKGIARCLDNVVIIEDRENVVYMSSAAIHAELKCMKTLLRSGVKWKYYINLTGQEFPLRTNLEIVRMLKMFHGANDIESYDVPRFQEWRFRKTFKVNGSKLVETNEVKKPFGYQFQLSKGSAYGMFTREFVNFILTDDVANKLIKWLNDTSSPEENLWATLNSLPWAPGGTYLEVRQSLNTHASRALIWSWDKTKCRGSFVRSVCVFGADDLHWLTSRPNVIANKFNVDLDPAPLDCLESWVNRRVQHSSLQTIDMNYISQLPHVKFYKNVGESGLQNKVLKDKKLKWLKKHPWQDDVSVKLEQSN